MKTETFDSLSTFMYSKKKQRWMKLSNPTSAYMYKKKLRCNLMTGKEDSYELDTYLQKLQTEKIFNLNTYKVHHLFFELGYEFFNLPVEENQILALELSYEKKEWCDFSQVKEQAKLSLTHKIKDQKSNYNKVLNQIFGNISDGEYYQLNFTKRWKLDLESESEKYLMAILNQHKLLGAMAHFTIVPTLKKIWFSNTPECLFVVENEKDHLLAKTFPIKGTVAIGQNAAKARKKLTESKKDLAELDMITDLMRNDLNKIEKPTALVEKRRFLLEVPELYHQASKVVCRLSKNISLGKLILSLFPGGSITGAPKKAALKYIAKYEKTPRGFYCGTTIFHSRLQCSASINIRSAVFNSSEKNVTVAAGGGITLKSKIAEEWQEMQNKKLSLINLWKN